ncbi:hypothetical protein BCR33DRAFT_849905 [Rhizoclosmatium globosum]|uniref:HAD-like protein n=1 Tax=Rhizoclosmatium globosum TaxID=329046 RepID=A0A1Y2CH94_9FUNG|nr:hypothetical protein BCR33DRAFT_849905 [Rhizoclosmatium globosum]|eukprot:ORY45685.1 hypothetical protein BCR33DRAFT_849905 [Rhizoclosmatium globosum]
MAEELITFHHTGTLPVLLVSDLDGTLLTPRHTVSKRSIEALCFAQSRGVQIMIASGRSPRSIQKVIDLFEGKMVPDSVICCNGALTYNPRTKEIDHPAFIPLDKAIKMVENLRSHIDQVPGTANAGFSCEVVWINGNGYSDDTYFHCDGPWELQRKHTFYYDVTVIESMESFLRSLQNPDGTLRGGIIKLMALDRSKTASELYESLPESFMTHSASGDKAPHLELTYSGPYFLEVAAAGVNKGLGLQNYCSSHKIDRKRVVAFGDLLNDAEMLQYAGLGLCMGNGHVDVKKLANRVIDTNADDGVAREIESWFDLKPSVAAQALPTGGTPSVSD